MSLSEVLSLLKEEDGFVLTGHVNPEGDAIGSCLALAEALSGLGKKYTLYARDPIPELYRFLPGWEKITDRLPGPESVLVLLDCSRRERAGIRQEDAFRKIIVIDHHETDCEPGSTCFIEPAAPATGMLVYKIVKALGIPITKTMALNLYAAISTDTGIFRYDNTTPESLEVAAELVRAGAEPARISENVYETWTRERMSLLCLSLGGLEVRDGVAVMSISREMFQKTGTSLEDTEHFTVFPRMLKGIQVAAFMTEVDRGLVKASLRSKGDVNVREIAEKFGGGGHRKAAGFRVRAPLNKAKEMLFKAAREALRSKA
jgi:phosphoesterase RecJ-like protein